MLEVANEHVGKVTWVADGPGGSRDVVARHALIVEQSSRCRASSSSSPRCASARPGPRRRWVPTAPRRSRSARCGSRSARSSSWSSARWPAAAHRPRAWRAGRGPRARSPPAPSASPPTSCASSRPSRTRASRSGPSSRSARRPPWPVPAAGCWSVAPPWRLVRRDRAGLHRRRDPRARRRRLGGLRTGRPLAVGAGASYAAFTLRPKRLLDAGPRRRARHGAAVRLGRRAAPAGARARRPGWALTPGGAAMALWLGAVPTALAYLLFARGLRHLPADEVATLTLAEPSPRRSSARHSRRASRRRRDHRHRADPRRPGGPRRPAARRARAAARGRGAGVTGAAANGGGRRSSASPPACASRSSTAS